MYVGVNIHITIRECVGLSVRWGFKARLVCIIKGRGVISLNVYIKKSLGLAEDLRREGC